MGVLDTFYVLFESDTSKLKQGLKEANDSSEKVAEGLLKVDETAKDVGHELLSMAKRFGAGIIGLFAIDAIKDFAKETANEAAEMGKMAKETGIAVEELDAYRKAVQYAEGDANDFNKTLENLADKTKDPIGYLQQMADKFKGLSDAKAADLGEKLGIEPGVVKLMKDGSAGLDELIKRQKELGVVTTEQAEDARKYKEQMRDLNRIYEDQKRQLITVVLPALTAVARITEKFLLFIRENKAFTIGFFVAVGAVITAIYLPAIIRASAATLALIAPYLALIAIVTAVGAVFGLLVDDIRAFITGGDSVIGRIAQRWPIVGDIVRGIAAAFIYWFEVAKAVLGYITDLIFDGPDKALTNLKERVGGVVDEIAGRFPLIADAVRMVGENVANVAGYIVDAWTGVFNIVGKVIDAFSTAINVGAKAFGAVKDFFGGGSQQSQPKKTPLQVQTEQDVKMAQGAIRTASTSPVSSINSNAISNQRTNTVKQNTVQVNGPITVQTQATDAKGVADGLGGAMKQSFNGAIDHFDDGVAA